MGKIDELLKNEKVEWKKLGDSDVCTSIRTGLNPRKNFRLNNSDDGELAAWYITTKDYSINEKIEFIEGKTAKITEQARQLINKRSRLQKEDILFSAVGTVGKIAFVDIEPKNFDVNESTFVLKPNKENILPKYLVYYLKSDFIQDEVRKALKGSTLAGIRKDKLERLEIPIPSIETQEKIVKTLDKFTNYVTELQAELQARTNQYQYYRDMLLSEEYLNKISEQLFVEANNSIYYEKISNLCLRQKGINITAKEMKELDKENGAVKIFAGGNTVARVDVEDIGEEHIINKHSVIVKSRGNIDFEYYDNPFSHKNEMWSYSTLNDNILNIKFLYYVLKSNLKYFLDNSISGKLPQISIGITDNYKIPVPSIEIQNKAVKILDKFQSLLADTKGLLPQEIEQRQKQYEYYREKLLTFDTVCDNTHTNSII